MNESSTSLDRLNDIVVPPSVPWWPPAPGWYVVIAVVLLLSLFVVHRAWKAWRANSYRRAALRELASLDSSVEIATLLKRTALAFAPRRVVAESSGRDWADWIEIRAAETMPPEIREYLASGIYAEPHEPVSAESMRSYASRWISKHLILPEEQLSPE